MRRASWGAALALIAAILTPPLASADDGCVSFEEYGAAVTAESFRQVGYIFGRATKRPNPPPGTDGMTMSPRTFVTFDYVGCDGATVYVVYRRPTKRRNWRDTRVMLWRPASVDQPVAPRN